MNATWMAWPVVCEIVEMNTPIPRVTNRKSPAPSANSAGLPLNGTSNSSTPIVVTMTMSRAASRK